MTGIKTKQLESEIHQKLSEIIAELDNSRANKATITDVVLNNDNSIANVYVTFMKENDENSYFELKKTLPFLRKELSHQLSVKKVPFINLELDNNLENINKMEELIKKVNK